MARMPGTSLPCPSGVRKPSRLSISFWLTTTPEASAGGLSGSSASTAAIASHSLASFSSSRLVSCSAITAPDTRVPLLDEHFLEQHVDDLDRRRRRVDARQQLLAQAIDAAGAAQILDPELAQIDLEVVDDARHDRLQPRQVLAALELEADRQLEEARLAPRGIQVHQQIRQVEERRRRRDDHLDH